MDLLARRVLARYVRARTTPLPSSFPDTEIGLMTKEEFLIFRNPHEKSHGSDSYDFDLFYMNRDYPQSVGTLGSGGDKLEVEKLSGGFRLMDSDGKVVAVVHDGTAYYEDPRMKRRIPSSIEHRGARTDLGITSYKQVKYLSEVAPLISPIAKKNEAAYPVILQHVIVKGEPMTVRAEKAPKEDSGVTLAVLNAEGLVVAQASNEWGATLLTVAKEYRGKGLGKIIGQFWYELNPSFTSGGFTQAGQENALALWRDRVHEFSSRGWYSALVQEGKLTYARVKEILAGAGEKPIPSLRLQPQEPEATDKATGELLVFVDDNISFVLYDRAFLSKPDEKFIHGYGFLRDAEVGSFFYALDYDRPYAELTTRIGLQMAREGGDSKLYDGEGYHDMLELDSIPGIVREGDYILITRDLYPLKAATVKERRLRKAADPYEEKYHQLLEMAESKWG
jgi:GNAT superfamily N-acetyltransferase